MLYDLWIDATRPTVTISIPVLNEEAFIDRCLNALDRQTYARIVEVLVIDGGSTDRTRELASRHRLVRVISNPRRIQSAGLNLALREANGDVFIRVDGHCEVADDYVARCVDSLQQTGAHMVGGAMTPEARGTFLQRGIAAAMSSRLGAGPARFHSGGLAGWVDTVYLGAYRTEDALAIGGYAEDQPTNEDAEFAHRMRQRGGVWFDPTIRSRYVPRSSIRALSRQFWRYGHGRAVTVRKHPASLSPRQLVAPALVILLLSPWRRRATALYLSGVAGRAVLEARSDPGAAVGFALSLPTMHVMWGSGFLFGVLSASARQRAVREPREIDAVGLPALGRAG